MKRLALVILLAGCYAPQPLRTAAPRPEACADSAQVRMRRDTTATELARLWQAVCAQQNAQARADAAVTREIPRAAEPGRTALVLILVGYTAGILAYLGTR